MTEAYEERSSCARCLRSSLNVALFGLILVLIGGGAYGGATIFARRYLADLLNAPNLFPCLDHVIYGLVGAVALFTLLAYVLCVLSSGWSAKSCCEGRAKAAGARCCNMTLILLLVCAVVLWAAIAGLVSYPAVSIALLSHRKQVLTTPSVLSALPDAGKLVENVIPNGQPGLPIALPAWPNSNENSVSPLIDSASLKSSEQAKRAKRASQSDDGEFGPPDSWPGKLDPTLHDQVGNSVNPLHSINEHDLDKSIGSALPDRNAIESGVNQAKEVLVDVAGYAQRAGSQLLACSPNMLDLSYYGLYDENGLPILISRTKFDEGVTDVFVCVCISLAGILLLLLGYLQIVICTAMNYARLQENRYYDSSDAGEEGVALQQ